MEPGLLQRVLVQLIWFVPKCDYHVHISTDELHQEGKQTRVNGLNMAGGKATLEVNNKRRERKQMINSTIKTKIILTQTIMLTTTGRYNQMDNVADVLPGTR